MNDTLVPPGTVDPAPFPPPAGTRVGDRYEVVRGLGQGGFGWVGEVKDSRLGGRRMALKLLLPHVLGRPDNVRRFLTEARAAALIHHARVVQVTDVGESRGYGPFMVMEFLDGAPLSGVIQEEWPIPPDRAVRIVRQVLEGLEAAHRKKVLHRDIKPENVFILSRDHGGAPDQVKVVDFGISRVLDDPSLTPGLPPGTPPYMAPEVLGGDALDARADVYGAAVVLHMLLTGRFPFPLPPGGFQDLGSYVAYLTRKTREDAPGLGRLAGGRVPPAHVVGAMARGLARRPEDRYPSCRALSDALEPFEAAGAWEPRRPRPRHPPYPMVRIEPGSFLMGSPPTEPGRDEDEDQHRVTLTRAYWLGEAPVTQGLWRAVTGENPVETRREILGGEERDPGRDWGVGDDLPIHSLSWWDAVRFANRLSELHGLAPAYAIEGEEVTWDRSRDGYRLPTEAEWEYAARAGTPWRWAGTDDLAQVTGFAQVATAEMCERNGWVTVEVFPGRGGALGLAPVRQKLPNPWGLYDMTGSVWEWCWDRYGAYPTGVVTDPAGPGVGADRVGRGGAWDDGPAGTRVANRGFGEPSGGGDTLGLRLSRSIP
ncbi:bifunctional serine/threonine-protein kinase/formylglycine-generating enzyme family protein [Myxococcota bacterium]|nr:bifunctional serine/threonine-protein kinase/formylglycine-generating enzyme family protein [Myxococcota bacterium]